MERTEMMYDTIQPTSCHLPLPLRAGGSLLLSLVFLLGGTGCSGPAVEELTGSQIVELQDRNVKVTLANRAGFLREGPNEFMLEFRTVAGERIDAGGMTVYFDMPAMGSMPYMKNDAELTTTSTPGLYRGTVTLEMKGTWQAKVSYMGQAGTGSLTGTINAR